MAHVSVIVPTFNNEKYLGETIKSILDQSYQPEDIIVVDDGSTDGTGKIVKSFGSKIKYIYQENQGLAVARNTGLANAEGKYFTFLDGDDLWMPENLEIKVAILGKDRSLAAVFSDFVLFSDGGVIRERGITSQYPVFARTGWDFNDIFEIRERLNIDSGQEIDIYKGNIFKSLLFGNFINACSIVGRKECQEKVGLFTPDLRTQQDYEYWLRFSKNYKMGYIDAPLVSYRRHPSQLTAHKNIVNIIKNVSCILAPYYRDLEEIFPGYDSVRFKERYANVYKSLGKAYLGKGENGEARDAFRMSYQIKKFSIFPLLYWFFSFCPPRITRDLVLYLRRKKMS